MPAQDEHIKLFTVKGIRHDSLVTKLIHMHVFCSSVSIATGYGLEGPGIDPGGGEIFRTCPDRPWGPPSLLYNGYRVFCGGKERP
jgi:hypothetical protein